MRKLLNVYMMYFNMVGSEVPRCDWEVTEVID